MLKTTVDDDGIRRFWRDNKPVGFWDKAGDAFAFVNGSAMHVGNFDDLSDARNEVVRFESQAPQTELKISKIERATSLIGFLAAELALYDPDNRMIEHAKEWLDARS